MDSVLGPSTASALQKSISTLEASVRGSTYDMRIEGAIDLASFCVPSHAKVTNKALSQCRQTMLVLSGYSQGAMCVHNSLSSDTGGEDVAAAVVFEGPLKGCDSMGVDVCKVLEVCGDADVVTERRTFRDLTCATAAVSERLRS